MADFDIDFGEYFSRQIKLWGEDKQKLLSEKKIAIIGCGGLGSSLALALGTAGIGKIDFVDHDIVSLHNIHRQVAFALKDEGKPKAQTVANLIRTKSIFTKVNAFDMDFASFSELDREYDLIIDATDNFAVRKEIDEWAKRSHTPWIYGSVEAFMGQVCFFDKASFGVFAAGEHEIEGVAAPIVMHIASLQANLALRYLTGLTVAKDKVYFLFFDETGELIIQKFNMPTQ